MFYLLFVSTFASYLLVLRRHVFFLLLCKNRKQSTSSDKQVALNRRRTSDPLIYQYNNATPNTPPPIKKITKELQIWHQMRREVLGGVGISNKYVTDLYTTFNVLDREC